MNTKQKVNALLHEYKQAMEWFADAVPSLGNAAGPKRDPNWKPRTLAAIESDMRALGYKWDYPKRRMVRIETPKQAAYLFFLRNAGFGYDPQKESRQAGRSRCARELAKAERDARALGLTFEWEWDEEGYGDHHSQWCDRTDNHEHQVFCCICRDAKRNVLDCLCSIIDPSREYRRVVEAELALEALQGMEVGK